MDLIKLKNIKLSKDEQEFIKNYRRMEDLEREKGIKFFQCIGDDPITDETRNEI
jgi:glutamate mutase epsilon subunit